jgi:D-amino peptidase
MKIWIGTDMEGIAGVIDREHTHREGREHDRARIWMTDEVNAAVAGCFDGGATAVTVTDGHGTCRNLIPERLDPRARLVNGQLSSLPPSMVAGLDETFGAAMLIGYHARAGLHPGVLDHTSWSQTASEVRLNGRPVGESELNAAYAGELGIPTVLVSGDDVLAADLVQSMPQVRTFVTKRALGRFQADTPHPSVVYAGLREAARLAAQAAPAIKPYVPSRPVTIELQFHHPMYTDLAAMVPGCRKTGTWSSAFTGESFMAAFGAFTAMCGVTGIAHYQHR